MRRLWLASVVAGCASHSANAPIAIGDFPGAVQAALCEKEVRCGLYDEVATCRSDLFGHDDSPSYFYSAGLAAVAAGRATYDAQAAGDCIMGYGTSACDQANDGQPSVCATVTTGLSATGASCAIGAECASGYCAIPGGSSTCPTGMCADLPAAGQPCPDFVCAAGARCDSTDLMCRAFVQQGGACNAGYGECASDLDCVPNAGFSGPGTCQPMIADGAACTPSGGTSYPIGCVELGDFCSADSKTCIRRRTAGESCNPNDLGCANALVCTSQHTCMLEPTVGQPCTAQCSDASFCDPDTHTCTAFLRNGATCTSPFDCASYNCDTATSTCVEWPPICL
jgi:hypothetical protein